MLLMCFRRIIDAFSTCYPVLSCQQVNDRYIRVFCTKSTKTPAYNLHPLFASGSSVQGENREAEEEVGNRSGTGQVRVIRGISSSLKLFQFYRSLQTMLTRRKLRRLSKTENRCRQKQRKIWKRSWSSRSTSSTTTWSIFRTKKRQVGNLRPICRGAIS